MPNPPAAPKPFAVPKAPVFSCPIQASMGVLGRKWALTVLRDIAFFDNMRFTDMLANNAGITPRVLSMRLDDLQKHGFIQRAGEGRSHTYRLTSKGQDAIPIMTAFTHLGIRHHAATVFSDGKPRTLHDLLPGSQREMLGPLLDYARA